MLKNVPKIVSLELLKTLSEMGHVDEKDIYRPAAWNAFGMDKEGQDYRTCAAYGPLYKNIR